MSGCHSSGAAAKTSFPTLRAGATAERSSHTPEDRGCGREEQPQFQGATAAGRRRAERNYSTFKIRRGGREEIPHVRGKRNPSKMVGVARGHQRADALKPHSQKTSQSAHRTTALCNSMKLSQAVWGHPRRTGHGGEGWLNVVHWRREWQTTSVFLP